LRAGGFEFGDISLIRLELLRSTGSRGPQVESQNHALLPAKVSEPDGPVVLVREREIRGPVANFQIGARRERQQEKRSQKNCRRLVAHVCEFSSTGYSVVAADWTAWFLAARLLLSAFCALMFQQAACGVRAAWIDCGRVFVNVLNNPILVDNEGRAVRESVLFV
jgi:hypothetical protein